MLTQRMDIIASVSVLEMSFKPPGVYVYTPMGYSTIRFKMLMALTVPIKPTKQSKQNTPTDSSLKSQPMRYTDDLAVRVVLKMCAAR